MTEAYVRELRPVTEEIKEFVTGVKDSNTEEKYVSPNELGDLVRSCDGKDGHQKRLTILSRVEESDGWEVDTLVKVRIDLDQEIDDLGLGFYPSGIGELRGAKEWASEANAYVLWRDAYLRRRKEELNPNWVKAQERAKG